jgi:hypothetical protein
MLAASWEGPPSNTGRLFVDGRLEAATKWASQPATNNHASWAIGGSLLGSSSFFGAVADVRVYNDALDLSKVAALYRCATQPDDMAGYYYVSIFYPGLAFGPRRPGDISTPFSQSGSGYGGMQLARKRRDCAISDVLGADVGQDLRISADILVPIDSEGRATNAGPYFRARSAAPGDGIVGGAAAGYWLRLESSGRLRVERLNPHAVVAFANPISPFDPASFHHVEMDTRGNIVTASLDGRPIEFVVDGKPATAVPIPPLWDGPPRIGKNQGAAGVAFGSELSHNEAGGQQVKNLQVTRLK